MTEFAKITIVMKFSNWGQEVNQTIFFLIHQLPCKIHRLLISNSNCLPWHSNLEPYIAGIFSLILVQNDFFSISSLKTPTSLFCSIRFLIAAKPSASSITPAGSVTFLYKRAECGSTYLPSSTKLVVGGKNSDLAYCNCRFTGLTSVIINYLLTN